MSGSLNTAERGGGYLGRLLSAVEGALRSLEEEEASVVHTIEEKRRELESLESRLADIRAEKDRVKHILEYSSSLGAAKPRQTEAPAPMEAVEEGGAVAEASAPPGVAEGAGGDGGEEADEEEEEAGREAEPPAQVPAERRWTISFNGSPVGEAVLEGGGRLRVGWCFLLRADSRYLRGVVAKKIVAGLIRTGCAESLEEGSEEDGGSVWVIKGIKPEQAAALVEKIKYFTVAELAWLQREGTLPGCAS
jgi:hypothetical protein